MHNARSGRCLARWCIIGHGGKQYRILRHEIWLVPIFWSLDDFPCSDLVPSNLQLKQALRLNVPWKKVNYMENQRMQSSISVQSETASLDMQVAWDFMDGFGECMSSKNSGCRNFDNVHCSRRKAPSWSPTRWLTLSLWMDYLPDPPCCADCSVNTFHEMSFRAMFARIYTRVGV